MAGIGVKLNNIYGKRTDIRCLTLSLREPRLLNVSLKKKK